MTPPSVAHWSAGAARRRFADYVELTKPRVVLMVLVTTVVGFYLATPGPIDGLRLLHTLLGTAAAAAGTMTLNQVFERDRDRRMRRTRQRPLPEGRIQPGEAWGFGLALLVFGHAHLAIAVNSPCAVLTFAIAAVYLLLYTPLKSLTSLAAVVGAVPGALPPVAGWAAATGALGVAPWVLFAIMFLWQIPHTLAIATLYRDDYAEAGIRVLPVIDWGGDRTGTNAMAHCLALLPVALAPTLIGLAGAIYFVTALIASVGLLATAVALKRSRSLADARRLLVASLIYLPLLLAVMALDKGAIVP